jgi:hypothetical protein
MAGARSIGIGFRTLLIVSAHPLMVIVICVFHFVLVVGQPGRTPVAIICGSGNHQRRSGVRG